MFYREFNKTATTNNAGVSEASLVSLMKLAQKEIEIDETSIKILQELLKWPKGI